MILMFGSLLMLFLWVIADRSLKDRFTPYLKWPALGMIMLLMCIDLFFFVETERFYKAKEIGGDLGIKYSWFNNATNSTVEHTMYALQDVDSANIFAYHAVEMWFMEDIIGIIPYISIFVAALMSIQVLIIIYENALSGKGKIL